MILTKDVQNARYTYTQSQYSVGKAGAELTKALLHLKHMKHLYLKGAVKHKCYQSYKASTSKQREELVEQLKQSKIKMHNDYRTYDKIKTEFDKQNPQDTTVQDALSRLSEQHRQALKEYFLSGN